MVKQIKKSSILEDADAFDKILHWFFSYPLSPVSLSDLSKQLDISKTTANRIVTQLVNENFLIKEVLGRIWRLSANQKHPYFITRKIGYNLVLIYGSGIIDAIHERVSNARAIVLFGSYRKGDDTEKSDIDIAVEVLTDEEPQIIELGVIELGYRKNVPINLHVFSRNKVDLNLFANIANGIVLEGFLEVRP